MRKSLIISLLFAALAVASPARGEQLVLVVSVGGMGQRYLSGCTATYTKTITIDTGC
jgi:hypothetical protein